MQLTTRKLEWIEIRQRRGFGSILTLKEADLTFGNKSEQFVTKLCTDVTI